MAGLQDLLSWADNKRRVVGRNLSDLVNDPANAIPMMADRAGQTAIEHFQDPMNFVGGGAGTFIGKGAKTWQAAEHARAQQMAAEGVDPRAIWKETGNWQGPDGHWRQEIPDNAAKFNTASDLLDISKNADVEMSSRLERIREIGRDKKVQPDLFPKDLSRAVTAERAALKDAEYQADKVHGIRSDPMYRGNYAPLALEHPSLYQNYPELSNLVVKQGERMGETSGSLAGDQLDIYAKALRGDPRSTAVHEMQHGVQRAEGFAPGGSPTFAFTNPEAHKILADLRKNAVQKLDIEEYAKQAWGSNKVLPEIVEDYNKNYLPKIRSTDTQALDRELQNTAAYQYYRRLGGEAEARATQARLPMDSAQRRATFPADSYDVPLEQLILRRPLNDLMNVRTD